MTHKKLNTHALCQSSSRTFFKMISLNHCSEGWSCWTLCSSAHHYHTLLQWSRL